MLRERSTTNGTIDEWVPPYYRYYKYDLNTTRNGKRSQRKPLQLDLKLKAKRKKHQHMQTNFVLPNELIDISTSKTVTTTTLPTTPFVTAESTTAGITKSTDELQPSNREPNTTSEINSETHINDRMNFNETATNRTVHITSTTTEHSITYNVTADNPKIGKNVNRSKGKRPSNALWSRWQKWTKCSRSCGGGVSSQSRECLSR